MSGSTESPLLRLVAMIRCGGIRLLMLAVSVAALLVAGCSDSDTETSADAAGDDSVTLDDHQLSPVFSDLTPTVSCSVPVRNSTDAPVRFQMVSASCACSSATLDQMELAPEETTQLRLKINLHGNSGRKDISCRLIAETGPDWIQRVSVPSYRRLQFEGPKSQSFGAVEAQQYYQRTIPVWTHAKGGPPPVIVQAESENDQLAVTVRPGQVTVLPDGMARRGHDVTVELSPNPTAGNHSAVVTLGCDDANARLEDVLHVYWQVQGSYTVVPRRLFFGKVDSADDRVVRTVTIRRADGRSFTPLGLKTEHPAFSVGCSSVNQDAAEHEVAVTLSPDQLDSHAWTKLIVDLNDEAEPVLNVPLAALH